jgi:tRNA G18 (ribose-2'-O)-methylase SpoU
LSSNFTVRKFLSLPLARQHKNCAELVRSIYEKLIANRPFDDDLFEYRQLLGWMKEPSLTLVTNQTLSDQYHHHLKLAGFQHKEHHLLGNVRTMDRLEAEKPLPIAIYLDNLRSAHNVGSIVRTVEAFSLGTLYFSENTPFIDNKQVRDTAMGADAWIQCQRAIALNELPKPVIALETSDDAISIYDFIFPEIFTLVIGNEEYGCSEETLKNADCIVEIPLRGRKNSLNVANAFAIAANEIVRNRL